MYILFYLVSQYFHSFKLFPPLVPLLTYLYVYIDISYEVCTCFSTGIMNLSTWHERAFFCPPSLHRVIITVWNNNPKSIQSLFCFLYICHESNKYFYPSPRLRVNLSFLTYFSRLLYLTHIRAYIDGPKEILHVKKTIKRLSIKC